MQAGFCSLGNTGSDLRVPERMHWIAPSCSAELIWRTGRDGAADSNNSLLALSAAVLHCSTTGFSILITLSSQQLAICSLFPVVGGPRGWGWGLAN